MHLSYLARYKVACTVFQVVCRNRELDLANSVGYHTGIRRAFPKEGSHRRVGTQLKPQVFFSTARGHGRCVASRMQTKTYDNLSVIA